MEGHEAHRHAVQLVRRVEQAMNSAFRALAEAEERLRSEGVAASTLLSPPMEAAREKWLEGREPEPLLLPEFMRRTARDEQRAS